MFTYSKWHSTILAFAYSFFRIASTRRNTMPIWREGYIALATVAEFFFAFMGEIPCYANAVSHDEKKFRKHFLESIRRELCFSTCFFRHVSNRIFLARWGVWHLHWVGFLLDFTLGNLPTQYFCRSSAESQQISTAAREGRGFPLKHLRAKKKERKRKLAVWIATAPPTRISVSKEERNRPCWPRL